MPSTNAGVPFADPVPIAGYGNLRGLIGTFDIERNGLPDVIGYEEGYDGSPTVHKTSVQYWPNRPPLEPTTPLGAIVAELFGAHLPKPVMGDVNLDGVDDLLVAQYKRMPGSPHPPTYRDEWFFGWIDVSGGSLLDVRHHTLETTFGRVPTGQLMEIDGDGQPDVLLRVGTGTDVRWFRNLGGGQRWESHDLSSHFTTAEAATLSLRALDLDRDGDGDLLVLRDFESGAQELFWLENVDAGAEAWTQHVIDGQPPSRLHMFDTADLDGDGDPDVVVATGAKEAVIWWENRLRTGASWRRQSLPLGAPLVNQLLPRDLDADGDVDLVLRVHDGKSFAWFENERGNPPEFSYHESSLLGVGTTDWIFDDFDRDGDTDFAFRPTYVGEDEDLGEVYLVENLTPHQNATFPTGTDIRADVAGATSPIAADFNGDGTIDIAGISSTDNVLKVWLNVVGDGRSWWEQAADTAIPGKQRAVSEDLDHDGDTDIVVMGGQFHGVWWLENDGAVEPSWQRHRISGNATGPLLVADMDRDGTPEVVSGAFGNSVQVFDTPADPVADPWPERTIAEGVGLAVIAHGDLDRDGYMDLVGGSTQGDELVWLRNRDGEVGEEEVPFEVTTIPGSRNLAIAALAVADLDGDGDLDIVAADSLRGQIHWWENQGGDPLFWWRHEFQAPGLGGPSEIRTADMDRDGDMDIVAAGLGTSLLPQTVAWWENLDGKGSVWSRHADWNAMIAPTGVFLADVNQDARPDIVASSHLQQRITWWENEGGLGRIEAHDVPTYRLASGTATAVIRVRLTHSGRSGDSGLIIDSLRFALTDDQGDPLPEEALASWFSKISLHRDDGSGSFEPEKDTRLVTVAGSSSKTGVYEFELGPESGGEAVGPGASADFFLTITVPAESRLAPIGDFQVVYLADGTRVVEADGGTELSGVFTADFTSTAKRLGRVLHVDAGNSPAGADGLSWATAFPHLQDALDVALAEDEIWVARGTYLPVTRHGGDSERHRTFQLVNRVSIYGGFAGTETSRDARDWAANLTVLSGNLGALDSDADNCLHVFYHPFGTALDSSAVLDGVTITGGNANEDPAHNVGGGMFNDESSPTIRNCRFVDNAASQSGGAVCNRNDASPRIAHSAFIANSSGGGGAIANWNRSSPGIDRCQFERNVANDDGGALFSYIDCAPIVTASIFRLNLVTSDTGDGGAVYNGTRTSISLINCLFFGNLARNGGAVFNLWDSHAELTHATIVGNTGAIGGAVHNISSTTTLANSILWDNGAEPVFDDEDSSSTATFCDIEGKLWPGEGNLTAAPAFANVPRTWDRATGTGSTTHVNVSDGSAYKAGDAIELDNDGFERTVTDVTGGKVTFGPPFRTVTTRHLLIENWGSSLALTSVDENFSLHEDSPCIDAGSSGLVPPLHEDLAGNPRPYDGNGDGTASNDLGAFEFAGNVLFVDADATGDRSGLSWPNAFTNLQDALDVVSPGFEIWVAAGTYTPSRRSDPGDPRTAAFRLRNRVAIRGGFDPSSGVTALELRDPVAHATILSGNIGDPDEPSDNSYHVLYHPVGLALDGTAILDGFIVADGLADRDAPHNQGGGMFNDRNSPTVIDCTFVANKAGVMGGAICNVDASPRFTRCRIGSGRSVSAGNEARHGGGIYNLRAHPSFTDCRFENNRTSGAGNGGALHNDQSSPELTRVVFEANEADGTLTLFGKGGAIFCRESSPNLTDCVLTGNYARNDGAGIAWEGDTMSEAIGCEFARNAADRGGAVFCDGSSPSFTDTLFIGNIAREKDGGGMACVAGSAPVLTRCRFSGNRSGRDGGGLFCDASSPIVVAGAFNDGEAMSGGGIHCRNGSSPSLTECELFRNVAADHGGGIFLMSLSNPIIDRCAVAGNRAFAARAGFGGGIACLGSAPTVRASGITGNFSKNYGGGLWFDASAGGSFVGCVVADNVADGDGGGILCGATCTPSFLSSAIRDNIVTGTSTVGSGSGGGVACFADASPVFANCAIHGNETSREGGGLFSFGASPMLTNCVVYDNLASFEGGGFYGHTSGAVLTNTILWQNFPEAISPPDAGGSSIVFCLVAGGFGDPGDRNIDADPLFRDAPAGDFHLTPMSPCIDSGNNAAPNLPLSDFEGGPRIHDGNGDGTAIVDIGVDEFDADHLLSYADWKEAVIGDPDADDFADPDFDGFVHIMEFALDGDPFRPDAEDITPVPTPFAGRLYLSFRERPAPDIAYIVERSSGFDSWEVVYDSTTPETALGDIIKDGHTTSVGIPIAVGGADFLRLRIAPVQP